MEEPNSSLLRNLSSSTLNIPAYVLSIEFFLGGLPRFLSFSGIPLLASLHKAHNLIFKKSTRTAPTLFPVIPFRGDTPASVRNHMRWVGAWMCSTGFLLAKPKSRGSDVTLGLVLFWTGAGLYSQWKVGMKYWLPIVNALLGCLVWSIEKWKKTDDGSSA